MADAFDHCEELVRAGDKNRYLATLFAPQRYRRALYALYAFNLEVGRTRELAREPMPGEIRLQWWRDVLCGAGRGEIDAHPVAAALRDVVVRYRLPPKMLMDLIDARSFDLYDEPVASLSYLEGYAMHTSSTLIELAARILFDGRDPSAGDLVRHAGIAYAIAGLLLALPVHSARGQLYLPADLMQRYGAQAADAFAGKATVELRAVLVELRLRARHHLGAARGLLNDMRPELEPALLPVALVQPVLDRMERRFYRPLQVSELPQWRRQWILWRAARNGLRKAF
ncbi:MAG: squalene/phytoene synthase family protein [Xanthobacteraceae bacterium]|nr:squalene/phytoene synthase family protein [Xanthobacteraceae bacterium]